MTRGKIPRDSRERGYVLILMGVSAFALFGVMGLAVDIGRLYIIKNETQAYCDAAALAAALQLNGTSTGISGATSAALSVGNRYNFDSAALTTQCVTSGSNQVTTNCVTVDFAQSQNGTYSTSPGNPSGYIYARVQTTINATLYFMPALQVRFTSSPSYTQTVNTQAIAGQIDFGTNTINQGAMPYTAVTVNPGSTNFGFTVGQLYDMQWPQYNANRNKCGQGLAHVSDCFNSPPCTGDLNSNQVMSQVVNYWGSSTNGYWGFNSNSDIAGTVLGVNQEVPVYVGENLEAAPYTTPNCNHAPCDVLTNGNKASEAAILDERASEDSDLNLASSGNGTGKCNNCWNNVDGSSTLTDYFQTDTTLGNGRRTFLVPVVYPGCSGYNSATQTCTSTTDAGSTAVVGWAEFLLYSDASGSGGSSNWYKNNLQGNDPYCGIYVGPWTGPGNSGNGGGSGGGNNSGSGASRVKLVY